MTAATKERFGVPARQASKQFKEADRT